MKKLFPNIHAVSNIPSAPRGRKLIAHAEYDSDFAADLHIYRPVLSETLFSLLGCPIQFPSSPSSERHPIGAILTITLLYEGALIRGNSPRNDRTIRNPVTYLSVNTEEWLQHLTMKETLREVRRLVPTRRGPSFERPEIALYVSPGADLDAYLANVSAAFLTTLRYV